MTFGEKYGNNLNSTHKEIMSRVIEDLGYENLLRLLPFPIGFLLEKYKEDPTFNNTSMEAWDLASGFVCHEIDVYPVKNSPFRAMLRNKGVDAYSSSQGVSVLKSVARRYCEECYAER